jgi:hypothetical protein
MNNFNVSNITSISELCTHDGGRRLTPIFKGNYHPTFVYVTSEEFEEVRGNIEKMKELAVNKLNGAESKDLIHYQPSVTNYNVRCFNGNAHANRTTNINFVTCQKCLNQKGESFFLKK